MRRQPILVGAIVFIIILNLISPMVGSAPFNLESALKMALKIFGTKYVIDQFGPQINDLINGITRNQEGLSDENTSIKTKIVPILSAGTGGYIGAVQVCGSEEQVEKVKAVLQLEGAFLGEALRATVLVPIDRINVADGIKRVSGVGVSAIVDFQL